MRAAIVVVLSHAAFAVACASNPPAPANVAPPAPGAVTSPRAVACPLGIAETEVTVVDIEDGVVVTFRSPVTTRIGELRQRVRDAAAMHGPGAHEGLGHDGQHGIGQGHGLHLSDAPASYATTEEVESGMQLRLVPLRPTELGTLRVAVRDRALRLASEDCP